MDMIKDTDEHAVRSDALGKVREKGHRASVPSPDASLYQYLHMFTKLEGLQTLYFCNSYRGFIM